MLSKIANVIDHYIFLYRPESQAETIANVLDKVGLASSDLTVQEKLEALCVIFNDTLAENFKYVYL